MGFSFHPTSWNTPISITANSAVSTPAFTVNGAWITGGTSTTTKPHILIEPSGTISTGWSTSGTGLGINAASGFAGNLFDAQVAGTSQLKFGLTGLILNYVGVEDAAHDQAVVRYQRSGTDHWSQGLDYDTGHNAFHLFNQAAAADYLAVLDGAQGSFWFGNPDVTQTNYNAQFRIGIRPNAGAGDSLTGLMITMPSLTYAANAISVQDAAGTPVERFYVGDFTNRMRIAAVAKAATPAELLLSQTSASSWIWRNAATTGVLDLVDATSGETQRLEFTRPTAVASAAGATLQAVNVAGITATITGATNITNTAGFNYMIIAAPTYSGTVTTSFAATLEISGSPTAAGGGAITNGYSLWTKTAIRSDGDVILTAIGGNNAGRIAYNNGSQLLQINDSASNPRWYVELTTGNVKNYGSLTVGGVAVAAGVSTLAVTPGAHTAIVAEVIDVSLATHSATFATGVTVATMRSVVFAGATYVGFGAAGAAGTITSAVTVDMTAPIAGANMTLTKQATLRITGSTVLGTAAIATDAANGFVYAPTCAGAPTGTPEAWAGVVPLVFDTTNRRLYVYESAAWHYFSEAA